VSFGMSKSPRSREDDTKGRRAPGRPKGTGSQRVYDELSERILSMDMKPGEDIDELEIVKAFGLSRTPVREALIRLQADGLIEIFPNRGARVAPIPFESIYELFEALEMVFRATAHLAALRRQLPDIEDARRWSREFEAASIVNDFRRMGETNRQFHIAIGRAAGNRYLAGTMSQLLTATMRFAYISHSAAPRRDAKYMAYFGQVVSDHDEMIDLIEARDATGAEALAGRHARLFQKTVSDFMMQNGVGNVTIVPGDVSATVEQRTRARKHSSK
jgi:DNA-binding GntR family transcriptional regulator